MKILSIGNVQAFSSKYLSYVTSITMRIPGKKINESKKCDFSRQTTSFTLYILNKHCEFPEQINESKNCDFSRLTT